MALNIPNSLIIINAGSHGGSVIQPAYYAEMYRRLWAHRFDNPDRGVEIHDLDLRMPATMRYRTVDSLEQERMGMIAYFAAGDVAADRKVAEALAAVFPEGLAGHVRKLLEHDARRLADAKNSREAAPAMADPSYVEAGVTYAEAIALMKAGYPTLVDVPDDLLTVASLGIMADRAEYIIIRAKLAALPTRMPTASGQPLP